MGRSEIFFNLQIVSTEYSGDKTKGQISRNVATQDMFSYYDRDEACDKTIPSREADTEDSFNYYNYRIGSTGCFSRKGMISDKSYFSSMNEYKPEIIYRGVFSFREDFALENDIMDPYKMRRLIRKTMDKNIAAMGFRPDNVEWYAFYHTNTAHPHVHFHFYEKERKKRRFVISKDRLSKVKSNVAKLMKINTEIYSERDDSRKKIIDELEKIGISDKSRNLYIYSLNNSRGFFKEDKLLTDNMKRLEMILPKEGSFKFHSANINPYREEIRRLIAKLKDKDEIKEYYASYIEHLEKEIEAQIILYGGSREDTYKIQFYNDRIEQLDSRIANMILANIKNYRLDKEIYENIDNVSDRKTRSKVAHNIRTRTANIVAGFTRELCDGIRRSTYSCEKMNEMMQEAQRRSKQSSLANQRGYTV